MKKPVLTKPEKIVMRQVVRILKRWKRVSWSWIKVCVNNMLIWAEQKRSADYYERNRGTMKAENFRMYDAGDRTEEDTLVYEYLNTLVKHYGGKG